MLNCFVVSNYGNSEKRLSKYMGHNFVPNIEDSNCLIFCGGADIDPALYGQKNVSSGRSLYHDAIDNEAVEYWERNKEQFSMLLGICRGGQRLNVLNGGSMWQDVNNHAGRDHLITDVRAGKEYKVNSIHHQMMRPHISGEIVAISTNNLATTKQDDTGIYRASELKDNSDLEVVWYPETKSLCFQAHPEYFANNDTTEYFSSLVNEFYTGA